MKWINNKMSEDLKGNNWEIMVKEEGCSQEFIFNWESKSDDYIEFCRTVKISYMHSNFQLDNTTASRMLKSN